MTEEQAKPEVKKEAKVKEASIVDVATQTAPMVQLEDGSVIDWQELQVRIYNKLIKLEKGLL